MGETMDEVVQAEGVEIVEKVEKVKKTPKKVVKELKELLVSIDTPLVSMLQCDRDGYVLYFESDVGRFKKLSEDVVRELTPDSKMRYMASYGLWVGAERHGKSPATKGLTIIPRLASATARLEVKNRKPGMHYAWATPNDMAARAYEGYQVSTDPELETFQGQGEGGSHRVAALGVDELVLMETSDEVADARRGAIEKKSQDRNVQYQDRALKGIRQDGGIGFKPERKRKGPQAGGPQFTPSVNPK